ncbi:hypothetical protein [uncultured Streptomyces sp.]|uniref:DUF6197 family protein n=1 Tax=uncultured Streptomyces sp. TaxID=174707 RepID=UPI00261C6ACD|nr:hypothetical protein [uncultured Streptomyces sp.]
MDSPLLTPDQLDQQVSRLHDSEAWERIVTGWGDTAPPRALPPALLPDPVPAAPRPGTLPTPDTPPALDTPPMPGRPASAPPTDWRHLLSVPVDRLVDEALRALPPAAPAERRLPGRLGAILPDRLHAWRRIGGSDVPPSVHLAHARLILTEWGWQNTPYRLRNARGARCLCGAMLTAHRLGYGSLDTVDRAGAWVITELRAQGWTDLIGPWNRYPGRTATDALALLDASIRRASEAGH